MLKKWTIIAIAALIDCGQTTGAEKKVSVGSIWAPCNIKPVNITTAPIVKGAVSYSVHRGYSDWDSTTTYHNPYAIFSSDKQKILGVVEFDKWDTSSEKALDKLIDPMAKPIKISTVEIGGWVPQLGSVISYLDNTGGIIEYTSYHGPTDIKNTKNYHALIKPHALLKDVKKVTIRSNCFFIGYHKSTITYHDDGSMEQATTLKYKIIVTTGISFAAITAGLVIKKLADRLR